MLRRLGFLKYLFSSTLVFFFSTSSVNAEYRAYYYAIYDKVEQNYWEVVTGFDPASYLHTQGKNGTVALEVKASWFCRGATGRKAVCQIPPALGARFAINDSLEVKIPHHISDSWVGVVEIIYWRGDLNSNIYGLRFEDHGNLYGNYLEKDLEASN